MCYRYNIKVAGISTDGDSRALQSMKNNLQYISESSDILSYVEKEQSTSYVQDPLHCFTKGRNRLLKASNILPMGSKQVSTSHLKILIKNFPKDSHGLVMSDICPLDRQNVASFEKVTDSRVIECLRENVIDSEATIMYLEVCKEVVAAFTDEHLYPAERIFKAWHGLYYFRAWKKWIQDSKVYNLKDNFITSNLLSCLEINAYSLLHLIIKFRNSNEPEFFIPSLFSSQVCETTFRQMRSMTTINWTRINFSLQELLHISGRIELINDIIHYKMAEKGVNFPRLQAKNLKCTQRVIHTLPPNEAIQEVLHKARTTALLNAAKMGMPSNIPDINKCSLSKREFNMPSVQNVDIRLDTWEDCDEDEDENTITCNSLRDYTDAALRTEEHLNENSKFVQVFNEDGSSKMVLKSSVIYLLTESEEKISKDRLQRVQGVQNTSAAKNRKISTLESSKTKKKRFDDVYVSDEIKIGDWCFFINDQATSNSSESPFGSIIFGSVLSFRYNDGKTQIEKQYTLDFAPTFYDENTKNLTIKPRGVSVSAKWYTSDNELLLQPIHEGNFLSI